MVIIMDIKIVKHGNHAVNSDTDGYMYNFNTSMGSDFSLHIHTCFEFIHIIHGKLLYKVENSEYMLSDGDFIMTKPDEFHSFSFPEECEYQREFLHIYPGFLKNYPEILESLQTRKSGYFNRIPADVVEKYGINRIFRDIEKCCAEPVEETDFMMLTYTLQLAVKIKQILRSETPENQRIPAQSKANVICSYIDAHFMEDISLEEIAKSVFMSPSHTSRLFKQETGMTIKSYLTMRRIRKAKNMIMEGHKTMSVFVDCGFSDYSTFYRAFMKIVGMSPDKFKQQQTKKI